MRQQGKKTTLADICGAGCEDYAMDSDHNHLLFTHSHKRPPECHIALFPLRCCNLIFQTKKSILILYDHWGCQMWQGINRYFISEPLTSSCSLTLYVLWHLLTNMEDVRTDKLNKIWLNIGHSLPLNLILWSNFYSNIIFDVFTYSLWRRSTAHYELFNRKHCLKVPAFPRETGIDKSIALLDKSTQKIFQFMCNIKIYEYFSLSPQNSTNTDSLRSYCATNMQISQHQSEQLVITRPKWPETAPIKRNKQHRNQGCPAGLLWKPHSPDILQSSHGKQLRMVNVLFKSIARAAVPNTDDPRLWLCYGTVQCAT